MRKLTILPVGETEVVLYEHSPQVVHHHVQDDEGFPQPLPLVL